MIDAFPTKNFGRFGRPDVIHTDQRPVFRNELFSELARMVIYLSKNASRTNTNITQIALPL
jgi:hypothetical protein